MTAPTPMPPARRTTENCRFCWMCRHVCPVGQVTRLETYTPHAWALTIESVARGQLVWNAETADVMYACADCGLCRTHCVTDQPLPDAIAASRARLVEAGAAPARVYELQRMFDLHGNPYAAVVASAATEPRRAPASCALFVGDGAHHLRPATVAAVIRLLQAAGADVLPVGVGRSSGWLPSSLGLAGTAMTLARSVMDDVSTSGARELLVLSPADAWAFTHVYPSRLGTTWPETVRIRHVTDLLAEAVTGGRLRFKKTSSAQAYAYHDPCHASRIGRDTRAPRLLLERALGPSSARAMFWREERAHPCGAIGGLEFTHPDIASQLAAARHADARAAGAAWLVTDDPTCCDHLAKQAAGLEVRSLYDVLDDAIAD